MFVPQKRLQTAISQIAKAKKKLYGMANNRQAFSTKPAKRVAIPFKKTKMPRQIILNPSKTRRVPSFIMRRGCSEMGLIVDIIEVEFESKDGIWGNIFKGIKLYWI